MIRAMAPRRVAAGGGGPLGRPVGEMTTNDDT
jgi:hypothetical protein